MGNDVTKYCWTKSGTMGDHTGPFDTWQGAVDDASSCLQREFNAMRTHADACRSMRQQNAVGNANNPRAVANMLRITGVPAGAYATIDGTDVSSVMTIKAPAELEHDLLVLVPGYLPYERRIRSTVSEFLVELVRPHILVAKCIPAVPQNFADVVEADFVRDGMETKMVNERAVVSAGRAFELVAGAQEALNAAVAAWAEKWVHSDAWVALEDTHQDVEIRWAP